jgi:NitT/TauT family transport system substrate-binding protein
MSRARQNVLALLTAGLLSLSLSAGPADPTLKIAVNITTIESFPLLAAAGKVSGVDLLPAPNGRNAMAQLVNSAADAATGSETQALLNSVSDPRIRIVLTLSECRYRIIARRSAGIRRLSDLRGKKIAVTLNTSSHYYLYRMLTIAHLAERDIDLISLEGQEMPAALEKHSVDAVSIWEPHAENSLAALGNDAVVFENPAAYTERFNLNTRTDVLADPAKRAALRALMDEIERSSNQIRTHSAEMIPSLAPKIGYAERTVFSVWRQFTFPASLNDRLGPALDDVESWIAASQKRQPRLNRELVNLIDFTVVRGK